MRDQVDHRRVGVHFPNNASDGNPANSHRVGGHTPNSARASTKPGNNGGADTLDDQFALLYDQRVSRSYPDNNHVSKSYDKIRQSFKCPRFSGQTKE